MFRPKVVSVAALLVLCLPSVGLTATIHVPGDQPTIQTGIDAAIAGDTVLVADGIYTGEGNRDIVFGGKGIVLKSENGPEVTIIDCEGSYRGFYFRSGEDSSAVVDGFTIQGGHSGITCYNSNPTIINNTISGNSTSYSGGGIYCNESSNPTIINNTISGNSASHGGGITCWNYSNPTISNNTISGNSASHGGGITCMGSSPTINNNTIRGNSADYQGGGIYCSHSSDPTISNNIISGNSAYMSGGIHCRYSSNPTISNNTISGNSADYDGGGIYCSNSNPTISNNTISGNSAYSWGGGILCSGSSPVITNTILAFNRSSSGAISCILGSSPTLVCCDIYGNEGGDWVDCIADQADINGNFSADPLFCDTAAGDYHLRVTSPCAPANSPCGALVGAYDVRTDCPLCGDADRDGQVTMADVQFLKEFYFELGPIPSPLDAGDANCSGLVNIGDIIYLADYLFRDGDAPCCP